MKPIITIGIATYRGADLLDAFFSSWRDARWSESTKIIVCDDGSPAEDAERISEIVSEFSQSLIVHRENKGCVAAYNTIFHAASAPVVALFDNDTLMPVSWIPTAARLFEAMPAVGVLSWASCRANDTPIYRGTKPLLEPATELSGYCFAMRKSAWDLAGGFDERYRHYFGDSDMCCKLADRGTVSYRVRFPVIPHHEHRTLHGHAQEVRVSSPKDFEAFQGKWRGTPRDVEERLLRRLEILR